MNDVFDHESRASPSLYAGETHALDKTLPACLRELQRNNSREWFHAHKEEFQSHVVAPLAALAEALAPGMVLLDDSLVKKLSRPQRDVRFSRDKSPYRTEMWFAFRRVQPEWTKYPAFFFEATPEFCRWGMGYYCASPTTMSALRGLAEEDQEQFLTAMAAAKERGFTLHGDKYKRQPLVPADLPEEIVELFRHRNVYLCRTMDYEQLLPGSELATVLAADYAALGGMYRIFCVAAEPEDRRKIA